MMKQNKNEKLFITFQPILSCANLKENIKSNNKILDDYLNLVNYRPIFSILLEDNPIEYIVADTLLSFPRRPEIAIMFKKDMSEVTPISRLQAYKFDAFMDNGVENSSLTWEKQFPDSNKINEIINLPYTLDGITDYLVSDIKEDEIISIYKITDNMTSISYDSLYTYNQYDFIQWVIDSLAIMINQQTKNVDLNKIPIVDTETEEFMELIQLIYNQFIYKPDALSEKDLVEIENHIEKWLYGNINPFSIEKLNKLSQDSSSYYNNMEEDNQNLYIRANSEQLVKKSAGLLDKFTKFGKDIEPFTANDMNLRYNLG